MVELRGKGVFGGVAIGPLSFFKRDPKQIKRTHIDDVEQEILRYRQAREQAMAQLQRLYDKALREVGESGAAIFEIHQMMLEDPDYCDSVEGIIRTQEVNAEYAVAKTAENFTAMFSAMEDAYMRGRSADVKDISERLVRLLGDEGEQEVPHQMEGPVIVAADDLAPSETVQLEKDKILGFVTMFGSASAHTAILARTMNIPAVVGVGSGLRPEMDGKLAAIDGFTGRVYIQPDDATLAMLRHKQSEAARRQALLAQLKGKENVTRDGQHVKIYANISSPGDVWAVLQNDAQGIGLYRSEFLYLRSSHYPTEEEQFIAYRTVAEQMAGHKVIIRTLDIGADKQVDYFHLPEEVNPAMGYRAIRICLDRPEIFRTQLRAICRATAFGDLALMLPMVVSLQEVRRAKELIAQVQEELRQEGVDFDEEMELGIMIETPAAALVSDQLAPEVDFFSIGTNDLTQYTLAADRQNPLVEEQIDPHHPAVLRLIRQVVENAHRAGIWAGICGELAADPQLTAFFLSLGIDELSVSPAYVLELRSRVRELDLSAVREEQRHWTE